jgi:hypothetical protein
MGGLEQINQLNIPIITITVIGDKEFVVENLMKRNKNESDHKENIEQVENSIQTFLNKAEYSQILIKNTP